MNTDNRTDSYRVQHTHKTRNTDTIKNTYVRKLTSIALMAIMVGGGLTFAIPGMEPAYAAQISSNPNLLVSAEGQNADNEIAETNIVEVVVNDGDINDVGDTEPRVTVDGETLRMYQAGSGAWYGYFAGTGFESALGLTCTDADFCSLEEAQAANVLGDPTPRSEVTGVLGIDNTRVHLFALDGEFDIVYEKAGGDQTVTLDLDNPDSSVSLDRTNYPRNTGVVATIDDQALNVDPTREDTWWFADNGASQYGDVASIQAYVTAANNRQGLIDDAQTVMDTAIGGVEYDGEEALGILKARQAAADVVVANALTTDERKLVLIQLHGQGLRTAEDDSTVTIAEIDPNYKGTALIAYEEQYGEEGTLQDTYEGVAGRGDRNVNSPEDSVHYKGTALILFQETAGNPQAERETDGTPSEANKGNAQVAYETEIQGAALPAETATGTEPLSLDRGSNNAPVLECAGDGCVIIDEVVWVKFTETDSNESKFDNTSDDGANLKTALNAARGGGFSVTYDNLITGGIGFSTTNIAIDAGTEWNSGQEIGVTLTDSDANTSSLDTEILDVSDPNRIIPTITIGDPQTLTAGITASLSGDITGTGMESVADGSVSQRMAITASGTFTDDETIIITISHNVTATNDTTQVVNYDLSAFEDATLMLGNKTADLSGTFVVDADNPIPTTFTLNFNTGNADATGDLPTRSAIAIDIFTFGLDADENNVNNAIYRLELEEDGDDSSDFVGTLEYIGLNQANILDSNTYAGIDASGDSIILISDDDSVSVEYRDLDATGGYTIFTAEADTPTHSGSVSLDSDGYKVADTVMVTVEDADLNVDSGKADVYTTIAADYVGTNATTSADNLIGTVLTVAFDGNNWDAGCNFADEINGLHDSQFTLQETGAATGVFTGTFSIPGNYCDDEGDPATVTGADVSVEYSDFRDDSGSTISVSASAGIRSTTGSVSLDRTVYPVPFGAETFATSNDGFLPEGKLTVYVSIEDSDFDQSSNGIDSIEIDGDAPLTVSVIRGSDSELVGFAGNMTNAIDETAPNSGVFEFEIELAHAMGPVSDNKCPARDTKCVLQGDILHVTYNDPSDASGSANTVTDSATFDLRNGVLQSDQTAYIIGSDMIVTMIEPDLNLDNSSVETYDLDLIEWDSDAGTAPLGDENEFDAVPSNLLETGADTGIFQVVVSIPVDIGGDRLERGEEITLTYIDHGPSGADYVGDKDEEVTTTVYTSNFGATIELDQRVYTWTDKVYITVVAPDHNIDSDQVDEIGSEPDYPIRVSTRGDELEPYKLVETGADTGIFTGEVILVGFDHDADGEPGFDNRGETGGTGPTDGMIETESESGISVSFKYSDGETVSSSALIRWNVGEVQWLEASYPASGSGIVRVIDPDMNLNPEAVDNFDIIVWSDSDGGGIDLTVTETNAATGIFEGTVFFGVGVDTSGHRLRVVEGDTVTAQYYDNTLPAPFKETERVRVGATTLIGTIVPPLERVPISDLRAVDSFGSTLDTISVDSQIQLAADLTNGQDKSQDFAYLIQIQDGNGVTVSLDWIAGSLTEGQSLSPASSWTPTEAGTYEVTAFAWESIENPTALSPTATIAITVN